jgi:hypothetical protein
MTVAQPIKPSSSPIAVTLKRLVALLEEEETDEYGILQPSQFAFKRSMELVIEAYDTIGDRFPKASASTDDQDGIRLTWMKLDTEREVRLVCPAQVGQTAYLYHEVGNDYAIERDLTGAILVEWLEWFNQG